MSDTITIRHNLDQLNRTLIEYQAASGKSWADTLRKQGGNLAFFLSRNLGRLAPGKGELRAEAIEHFKKGWGIRIRPTILAKVLAQRQARSDIATRKTVFGKKGVASIKSRGRRLNLQALAARAEINLRESARGFLGFSAKYPRTLPTSGTARSRYRQILSKVNIVVSGDAKSARIEWPGITKQGEGAIKGLRTTAAQTAIATAIAETNADIRQYIEVKEQQELSQAFSVMERAILRKI